MAHILIIEDEAHIRFLIQKVLEASGHRITEAWDGLDALDAIRLSPRPFDLLLLDIRMPNMDGKAFLAELKTLPSPPPVIIVSAYWDAVEKEPLVVQRITKPFTRPELLNAVNDALAGRVSQA